MDAGCFSAFGESAFGESAFGGSAFGGSAFGASAFGGSMSGFERLLEPGCTEGLKCRCGEEMEVARIERLPVGTDADIRIYHCRACHHEMRLTVWATVA
jgi:hypothetical protein